MNDSESDSRTSDTVSAPSRLRGFWGGPGVKRAQAFINLSNDGWFFDADDRRLQHAQIARFRCIENRVPMIRCVNTGMSVSIDSRGKVVGSIGNGRYGSGRQTGALAAELTFDRRITLYGRIGEVFPWLCVLSSVGLMIGSWLLGRRSDRPAERIDK